MCKCHSLCQLFSLSGLFNFSFVFFFVQAISSVCFLFCLGTTIARSCPPLLAPVCAVEQMLTFLAFTVPLLLASRPLSSLPTTFFCPCVRVGDGVDVGGGVGYVGVGGGVVGVGDGIIALDEINACERCVLSLLVFFL